MDQKPNTSQKQINLKICKAPATLKLDGRAPNSRIMRQLYLPARKVHHLKTFISLDGSTRMNF